MTVTYTSEVATLTGAGNFWKLLLRWRGSIYKLVWRELLLYITIYYLIRCVDVFLLTGKQKIFYAEIVLFCRSYSAMIPLSFVLGFYVTLVMTRWWAQYEALPWPDSMAIFATNLIHGHDERGRLMRRTIMRYINLSFVITLSMISPRVKKRFPTMLHIVEAGFMTSNEQTIYENFKKTFPHSLYWMPLVWAGTIMTRARKEGRIRDDFALKTLIDNIDNFRTRLGKLHSYDRISIPLVYTQVVTLAVYLYFASTLLGAQYVTETEAASIDLYIPWFTLLQYFFYMGWLKVAETLVNPFGEDDDDFELNWLIDRHIQVSYLIVDEMHDEHPELIQDKYWDEVMPTELPYTVAAEMYKRSPMLGSTANMELSKQESLFVRPDDELEDIQEGSEESINSEQPGKIHGSFQFPAKDIRTIRHRAKEPSNPELWTSPSFVRNESHTSLFANFLGRNKEPSVKSHGSNSSIGIMMDSDFQDKNSPKCGHKNSPLTQLRTDKTEEEPLMPSATRSPVIMQVAQLKHMGSIPEDNKSAGSDTSISTKSLDAPIAEEEDVIGLSDTSLNVNK